MKYLIVLSILISGSLAFANPCEDTRQLRNLWDTKYIKLIKNPEALGNSFNSSSRAYKLAQAICILEFPGLPNYNADFYEYLADMSKTIIVVLQNPNVPSRALAGTVGGVIRLYREFFEDRYDSPFARTTALIHESRHIELQSYGVSTVHVVCTRGSYAKERAKFCETEFIHRWEVANPTSYELMFLNHLYEKSVYYKRHPTIKSIMNEYVDNYFNKVSAESYQRYYKN